MTDVVNAHVRNGKLFAFIAGEEFEIVLPREYADIAKNGKKPAGADDDSDEAKSPKTEAHARIRWDSCPGLRKMLGVAGSIEAGHPVYEANFRRYARRVFGERQITLTSEDEKIIADAEFEAECGRRFAEQTDGGEPRYRMFGVTSSDTESPAYKAALKRFVGHERNWQSHGEVKTTGRSGQFVDPGSEEAALEKAERDARDRFATDPAVRASFGVQNPYATAADSAEYQGALARYVRVNRKQASEDFNSPAIKA